MKIETLISYGFWTKKEWLKSNLKGCDVYEEGQDPESKNGINHSWEKGLI